MTENLQLMIQLLIVGMLTVFFILGLVVLLGKLIIFLVNKYAPSQTPASIIPTRGTAATDKKHLAVLTSVVEVVTEGKGVIKSIKKL